MLWLTRQDKVKFYVHLHDFWMLQDLMHQPKYGGDSTVPRIPHWSLQGHPNVIQSFLQKRSRKLKRMIRDNATFLFSSSEVQEYFDKSIEYSSINSNLSKRVMPLSLEYIIESRESLSQYSLPRNLFLLIGLHEFQDQRKGFERALAGFRLSRNKFNCPLIIVCDLGGLDPSFIRDLEKENVFFFETVNHETVLELMGMARAVILPSEFETFGLAIFEALLCARYVGISVNTVQSTLVTNLGLSAIIQDWSQSNSWEYIFECSKENSSNRAQNHRALSAREVAIGESITSLFG
jgi:glycosyltransferase involved in cell wall biosynthesis